LCLFRSVSDLCVGSDCGEVSLGFGGKRRCWCWFWYSSYGDAVFFLVGVEFVALRKTQVVWFFCVVVVFFDLDLCVRGDGGVRW